MSERDQEYPESFEEFYAEWGEEDSDETKSFMDSPLAKDTPFGRAQYTYSLRFLNNKDYKNEH